jgi:5-amino-6-(5-phospho-D-ribitylamino)uracil phosphatase
MIKILALDLDGTTLNPRGEITTATRDGIRSAEEAGVLVTIATGRRFRDARPLGLELELNAPLITHNGALVKYAASGETVACSLLDTETSREVVRIGQHYGGDALVSTEPNGAGTLLYQRVSDQNTPLKKYLRWAENLHGGEAGREGVRRVDDFHSEIGEHEVVHITFTGSCDAMASLIGDLSRELGQSVTILPTIYTALDFTLIDVLPPDTSKGHGLRQFAEIRGIEPAAVMAIGDNFNDLEMLEFAGTAVVMGNADEKLLARREFYTTLTNDHDGVAAAIERFILNGENI